MTLLDVLTTSVAWAWSHGPVNGGPFFAETSNSNGNNNITLLPPPISPSSLLTPPMAVTSATLTAGLGAHPHGSVALRTRVHVAHGVLGSMTMVVLFPSVAIVLRVVASRHIVRWHYVMQLVNMGILLVSFALGVWLSWLDGWLWHWPHQILGTAIVLLFLLQPALGLVQHRRYLRTGTHSLYSAAHVWYGRLLICAGIINGGLGLRLAHNASTHGRWVAYVVVTLAVLGAYVAAQVWYRVKVRRGFVSRVAMRDGKREDVEEEEKNGRGGRREGDEVYVSKMV